MRRKDGPIPVIKSSKYPSRLFVFDTEADRGPVINGLEVQTFKIAVSRFIKLSKDLTVEEDEAEKHTTVTSLYQALDRHSRKDKTLYVYAHNVKYDLQLSGLFTVMLEDGWKVGSFVFDDPPTFVRLTRNRSSVMVVDTFNYWQTSLAKMGDQLGLVKLPMPTSDAPLEHWFTYCRRDVDVLTSYLLTFYRYLKDNDLCGLGLTLASQSLRTFRHRFMKTPIVIHNRPEAIALERAGYSGGRVEAFFVGEGPKQTYYKLDVNSMYPFVMKNELYPTEFVGYTEGLPLDRLPALLSKYYVIGEFEIDTTEAVYAYKGTHKLIFPTGRFRTVLHSPDIKHALSRGHIKAVIRIAVYKAGDLFSGYIDYFYGMKVKADRDRNPVVRHQAKILMNSLYGKFGQQDTFSEILDNTSTIRYGRMTGYSEALGHSVEVNYLGSQMEVSYKEGEAAYSFPGIAGAVTSYARLYLYDLMSKAGLDNVYYVDTDSLIVNQAGMDNLSNLIDPDKLGYLKVEGISDILTVWGCKDYQFGAEVKHKGVPKTAIEEIPGQWLYEQFRGASTWLKDGLPVGVHVNTRIKKRKSTYDKGVVLSTGFVRPLILANDG